MAVQENMEQYCLDVCGKLYAAHSTDINQGWLWRIFLRRFVVLSHAERDKKEILSLICGVECNNILTNHVVCTASKTFHETSLEKIGPSILWQSFSFTHPFWDKVLHLQPFFRQSFPYSHTKRMFFMGDLKIVPAPTRRTTLSSSRSGLRRR